MKLKSSRFVCKRVNLTISSRKFFWFLHPSSVHRHHFHRFPPSCFHSLSTLGCPNYFRLLLHTTPYLQMSASYINFFFTYNPLSSIILHSYSCFHIQERIALHRLTLDKLPCIYRYSYKHFAFYPHL